jgi:hypothetical protein
MQPAVSVWKLGKPGASIKKVYSPRLSVSVRKESLAKVTWLNCDIPMLARVLSVADCFDALTSARAYRSALAVNQAVELMEEGAGKQFQAEFAQAFIDQVVPVVRKQLQGNHYSLNGSAATQNNSSVLSSLSAH